MVNLIKLIKKYYLQIFVVLIFFLIIFKYKYKYNKELFYHGNTNSKEKLNKTLLLIIKLLQDNKINNWFIGYGTLLGIVRENSCIDGDDDIDIICDINNYNKIKYILTNNGFTYKNIKSKYILKTEETDTYTSVDFYMSEVDKNGNFKDNWENVIWSNCYNDDNKLIEYKWNNSILYFPNNFENKLKNRYGNNWRKPQKTKGPMPRKKIL